MNIDFNAKAVGLYENKETVMVKYSIVMGKKNEQPPFPSYH